MFAIRYLALAALSLWVGATWLQVLGGQQQGDAARMFHRIALGCGSTVVVTLSAMKLLGPPPAAFPLRLLVAATMLAISIASVFAAAGSAATALTLVNAVAGLFLLSFYARE